MAVINAQDVKKLREKTGAGMMDCKNALEKADGNPEAAERILKEMGLAAVAKRAGKIAEEGRIFTFIGKNSAGILEISCETDFVARNAEFIAKGTQIVTEAVEHDLKADDPKLVDAVTDMATLIKENIQLRRLEIVPVTEREIAAQYIHGDSGKVGVLLKISVGDPALKTNESVLEFAKNLSLHAAAFSPAFLDEASVPADYLKEQESIFRVQAQALDKPENVLQGIVKGKLSKHLKEVCFTEQPFVKDEKRSVLQVAKDLSKEIGTPVALTFYRVYRAGEEL